MVWHYFVTYYVFAKQVQVWTFFIIIEGFVQDLLNLYTKTIASLQGEPLQYSKAPARTYSNIFTCISLLSENREKVTFNSPYNGWRDRRSEALETAVDGKRASGGKPGHGSSAASLLRCRHRIGWHRL